MNRIGALTLLVGLLAFAAPATTRAQLNDCNIICPPVFVSQTGVILTNFADQPKVAPGSTEEVGSDVDFLIRFTTAFGTQWDPLFIAVLFQWTPFATPDDNPATTFDESDIEQNAPVIVFGPGLHIVGPAGVIPAARNDYFALDFLPLGVHGGDPTGNAVYSTKFVPEWDLFFNIGKVFDPQAKSPWFNAWNAYLIIDYVATGLDVDPTDPAGAGLTESDLEDIEASPWVLIFGLTIPIAPIPGG